MVEKSVRILNNFGALLLGEIANGREPQVKDWLHFTPATPDIPVAVLRMQHTPESKAFSVQFKSEEAGPKKVLIPKWLVSKLELPTAARAEEFDQNGLVGYELELDRAGMLELFGKVCDEYCK